MTAHVKFTADEMHYISLFESITGAIAKDCIIDENGGRIIFVVKAGNIGLAIGRGGSNIKRVRKFVGKLVDVVEYAVTPENFIKNILTPAKIKSIHITEKSDGKRIASIEVEPSDRGIAIGKNGKNIMKARILAKRHFGIDDVKIK